jgi:hypothetical protein
MAPKSSSRNSAAVEATACGRGRGGTPTIGGNLRTCFSART